MEAILQAQICLAHVGIANHASVAGLHWCQCPAGANEANGEISAQLTSFLNILLGAANQIAVPHLWYLPGHSVPLARAYSQTGPVKANAAARIPLPAHALTHATPESALAS